MQTVARLGVLRVKSELLDEKLTMKHSVSSMTESDVMETDTHCVGDDSDRVTDPLNSM